MSRPLPAVLLPTLLCALACGGISKDIASSSFVKQSVQLKAVEDTPEKVSVAGMLDDGWLKAQIKSAGFTARECEFDKDDGFINNSCNVVKLDESGIISLMFDPESGDGESRSSEDGSILLTEGHATLAVTMWDDKGARQLLADMTRPLDAAPKDKQ